MGTTEADALREEAAQLVWEQREHRGWRRGKTVDGEKCLIIEPYKPTAETELKANRIVSLRRKAARCERQP